MRMLLGSTVRNCSPLKKFPYFLNQCFCSFDNSLHDNYNTNKPCFKLEGLNFVNTALNSLPIDPETRNFIRQVPDACFSTVHPIPIQNPKLVSTSKAINDILEIEETEKDRPEFVNYFSGNSLLPGSQPLAHCYCGHQFGNFSGQLGDGAAILLGDILNSRGERWELQLKGAGKTPYSRGADGRKVLRSSIREYLCSEAMHYLGVPTTRAGSIVTSDSYVMRDILYNGNVINERSTVVLRLSPTFLRFGSLEIFKQMDPKTHLEGPSTNNDELRIQLLDFIVKNYFGTIYSKYIDSREKRYEAFFAEVVRLTAELVAKWQCIGFTHGVLNTDNMSILGLTIDYGPYGFMESYDRDFVPNASDTGGRYSYQNQPSICKWNVQKLMEMIEPVANIANLKESLEKYDIIYETAYLNGMRKKLGLFLEDDEDLNLIEDLFDVMEKTAADFRNTFLILSNFDPIKGNIKDILIDKLIDICGSIETIETSLLKKISMYQPFISPQQLEYLVNMIDTDPSKISLQFGVPLEVIKAEIYEEVRKFDKVKTLVEQRESILSLSADGKKIQDRFLWEEWITKFQSRLTKEISYNKRLEIMNQSNPTFILRNWILQEVINNAEKGNFNLVNEILQMCQNPFDKKFIPTFIKMNPIESLNCNEINGLTKFVKKTPDWASKIIVT